MDPSHGSTVVNGLYEFCGGRFLQAIPWNEDKNGHGGHRGYPTELCVPIRHDSYSARKQLMSSLGLTARCEAGHGACELRSKASVISAENFVDTSKLVLESLVHGGSSAEPPIRRLRRFLARANA